ASRPRQYRDYARARLVTARLHRSPFAGRRLPSGGIRGRALRDGGPRESQREDFVRAGAQIYGLAMPLAQRLYLTEIERDFPGDTFFPEYDRSAWREVSRERRVEDGAEGFGYAFVEYERA